jgi:outer membrane protein OmpA-like peptidoglycan-associated protein
MAHMVRQTASAAVGSSSSVTVRRRLLVRRSADIWPFIWRGLLPTLGLIALAAYAVWPFARQTMESSVRQQVTAKLSQEGFDWIKVLVSGQQVFLSGSPPSLADGPKAIQSAFGAQCPTWAGARTCAISVVGAFAPAMPAVASASATLAAPSATLPTPPPAAAPAASVAAAATPSANTCARQLNELLARSRIEFASGQASITPAGAAVLDRLADAVKACPGALRLEGHTDNVGDAERNRALSQARADAVKTALVQRGVESSRLATLGLGADRPRADNATAEGRAENRRIEIHPASGN